LVLIGAAILIDCAALVLDIMMGRRLVQGRPVPAARLELSSQLSGTANYAVPAAVLIGGIVFLWWFHCAYRRADQLQATKHSPPWAIASWFVPVINLFRPPQIMAELSLRQTMSWAWWALWAVGAVVQAALRFISPETQQGWVNWQTTALISNLVLLGALVLALILVDTVSEVARGRSRYWHADSAAPSQPPKLTTRPIGAPPETGVPSN
jgi:hypothetical protein